ncbi:YiiD C-terminal domain-containing protein [Vibrio sonorensis]|uniref:YiiD C-terminal domain-containing protein n=1 Tax=Vibrio sonorensis TaxID=1004316 RepID=UPI0008DA2647|nr:YiiD C-terminal domain-containing protein [Vibrio sonorensis]
MNKTQLEAYLHQHIPQSKSMAAKVDEIGEDFLAISAPLDVNINHRDSVYGGSASSVAILSAWAFLHTRLNSLDVKATLVIQSNTMSYDKPILDDFTAVARANSTDDWSRFLKLYERRGKARIQINSTLYSAGQTVGEFTGQFVAIKNN